MAKKKAAVRKTDSIADFMQEVNGAYGQTVVSLRNSRRISSIRRTSTGIFDLDVATGGGWPVGRSILIIGEFSTGKTELATQAAISMSQYDKATRKRLTEVEDGEPCRTLFVDFENALDEDWVNLKGFDTSINPVCQPDSANQGVDIIDRAIAENHFGLIIVDSISSMSPAIEIEKSADEAIMGAHAKLVNSAYRKWVRSQLEVQMRGEHPATIIALNHPREKIGFVMGDPRVIPHGKKQQEASSVIVWLKTQSYDASNKQATGLTSVALGGNLYKNKTHVPRQNFECDLYLRDAGPEHPKGSIDNIKPLLKRAKDQEIIRKSTKKSTGWVCMGMEVPTLKKIEERCRREPAFMQRLWDVTVKKITGYDAKEGRTV